MTKGFRRGLLPAFLLFAAVSVIAGAPPDAGDRQPGSAPTAESVLARLFSTAQPALAPDGQLTKEGDAAVAGIDNLGPGEKQKLVASLVKELGGADSSRAFIARIALSRVGAPAIRPLIAMAKDQSAAQRRTAVLIIGDMGANGKPAAPELIGLLADGTPANVRSAIVRALGQIGATEAIPAIVAEMKTGHWVAAYAALGDMGSAAAPAIPALWDDYRANHRKEALAVFKAIGPAVLPPMLVVLRGADIAAKADALAVLTQLGQAAEPALPEIIALWSVPSCEIPASTAMAAIGLGAKAAVPMLIAGLADRDSRISALITLGAIGPNAKAAVPYLIDIVEGKPQFTLPLPAPGTESKRMELLRFAVDVHQEMLARNALEKIGTPEALAAVKKFDAAHPK